MSEMPVQGFGGEWTEEKLRRVRKYLQAYAIALKDQPFRRIYIDGFAGTGSRTVESDADQPALGLEEFAPVAKGSAQLALEIEPPFDSYIFIEKDPANFAELRRMTEAFPIRQPAIQLLNEEANEALVRLCHAIDWRKHRAVLFLDPFGMQVRWNTVRAIAETKAIDLWYLFPSHIGVGRMLPRSGEIRMEWQTRLDESLGDTSWRNEFFEETASEDLFGGIDRQRVRAFSTERIEWYFKRRLETIFAGVADRALPLSNSRGVCMYMLFFACGNPRGKDVALRIANHLLKV